MGLLGKDGLMASCSLRKGPGLYTESSVVQPGAAHRRPCPQAGILSLALPAVDHRELLPVRAFMRTLPSMV